MTKNQVRPDRRHRHHVASESFKERQSLPLTLASVLCFRVSSVEPRKFANLADWLISIYLSDWELRVASRNSRVSQLQLGDDWGFGLPVGGVVGGVGVVGNFAPTVSFWLAEAMGEGESSALLCNLNPESEGEREENV